jgi:hypothetical protein
MSYVGFDKMFEEWLCKECHGVDFHGRMRKVLGRLGSELI